MRFWDSSALVPLVVEQPGSVQAERWLDEDGDIITWTLTSVEIASALRRLTREGALDEARALGAERIAEELLSRTHVVTDIERVKATARRLLRVHDLRAADAMQLAAALAWSDGESPRRIVHTFDVRLARAARREGFEVIGDSA